MNAVYIRLALYLASTLLGMIPASFAGWVSYNAGTHLLSVNVEGLLTAIVAAIAVSGGVFAKWGVK